MISAHSVVFNSNENKFIKEQEGKIKTPFKFQYLPTFMIDFRIVMGTNCFILNISSITEGVSHIYEIT